MNDLLGDLAAHPRNRIDRGRIGPRTVKQHQTQRGIVGRLSSTTVACEPAGHRWTIIQQPAAS
ncbi:hypothetical protein OG884_31625 [Streptosporangium sp. NBC_01755]|uniref:hypothetical protein n=1 Tax=unclassified Streptosporangium TaxID=2632669 RepID=UPI002DDC8C5A|nr:MULTISPECIES: hypothetical protein [unclassified Streptosporangium]WSA29222.1 hypothetical protein OIE13_15875 [Streptosporangium sp. NBC_01810]WSC99334.1 hypothetical protein OG884_31625 [Streptosporangium sp. NBC_01755]